MNMNIIIMILKDIIFSSIISCSIIYGIIGLITIDEKFVVERNNL